MLSFCGGAMPPVLSPGDTILWPGDTAAGPGDKVVSPGDKTGGSRVYDFFTVYCLLTGAGIRIKRCL